MIAYQDTGTGLAPVMVCDCCKKRIEDAELGAAIRLRAGNGLGGFTLVAHVHKEVCFGIVERCQGGAASWDELSRHLRLLIQNVGLTLEGLLDEQRLDVEFGLTNR